MIRLALGRLYDQALMIPAKLDDRIRRIAALINGGLTNDNLAPAFKLPASAFAEGRQILAVSMKYPYTESYYPHTAPSPNLPCAATLLAVEIAWASVLNAAPEFSVARWDGAGVLYPLDRPSKVTLAWASRYPVDDGMYRGSAAWYGAEAFAAGDAFTVLLNPISGGAVDAHVVAYFVVDPIA